MKITTPVRAIGASLLVAASLLSSFAQATTFTLLATSGQPAKSGTTYALNDSALRSGWTINDGQEVRRDFGTTTGTWIVPIPITSTNDVWTLKANQVGEVGLGNTNITTRLCAFNPSGSFAGCGGTIENQSSTAVSILVPTDGVAYSQSFMFSDVQIRAMLRALKVYN